MKRYNLPIKKQNITEILKSKIDEVSDKHYLSSESVTNLR